MNAIHFLFFILYALISIPNHYLYRSSGLDYAIVNQALYKFAHFQTPEITVLLGGIPVNYFGLHLSLWVPIFSPLYWIFGSYTMLIIQILALLFAGVGIVKLSEELLGKSILTPVLLVGFYSVFSIYNALAFDFHDNVIGSCFLPWLILSFKQKKTSVSVLCFVAMLISKENFAIWLIFILAGLVILNKPSGWREWKLPLLLLSLALIWFGVVSVFVMPSLSPVGKFEQLSRYSHLGKTVPEIVHYILMHPLKMVKMFYQSHIQPDPDEIVKHEFLFAVLISGGAALLIRPAFLLMALPVLMQKLWNKELAFWGVSYHYQVEMAVILIPAVLYSVTLIKSSGIRNVLGISVTLLAMITTYSLLNERKSAWNPVNENFMLASHYTSDWPVQDFNRKLSAIDPKKIVCAQSNILPHIAFRDGLYHFPFATRADLVICMRPQLSAYPLSNEKGNQFVDSLLYQAGWKADSACKPLLILSRP